VTRGELYLEELFLEKQAGLGELVRKVFRRSPSKAAKLKRMAEIAPAKLKEAVHQARAYRDLAGELEHSNKVLKYGIVPGVGVSTGILGYAVGRSNNQ
jgi:hypothetical protein